MKWNGILLCAALSLRISAAQSKAAAAPQPESPTPQQQQQPQSDPDLVHLFKVLWRPYLPEPVRPTQTTEPASLGSLIQGGEIHLSVADAIRIALANNLDIASARLLKPTAEADMQRANSGQLLRNVPTGITTSPPSASGPFAGATAAGYEGQDSVLSGLSVQLAGSQIPQLDPVLYASGSYSHDHQPLANQVVAGINVLNSQTQQWQVGVQKAFLTGTSLDVSFTNLRLSQNSPNNNINPAINGDGAIKIQQPLLQGASIAANTRAIHIAKNNQAISDLTFREQVSETVSEVLILYYDLVTFRDQLDLAKRALDESSKQLEDNKRRIAMGTITESDLTDSEAAVDLNQQLVDAASIQIEEQEATLKTVLTRKGLEDSAILAAPIIPTDRFALPPGETKESIGDIAERAIGQRPEVRQSTLELENKRLSLLGTREAMKPVLNIYADLQSNALVGRLNALGAAPGSTAGDAQFVGGAGNELDQIVTGAHPDYEFGFELNMPLRNRAARADMRRDQIDLEQQQIAGQRLSNEIRLQAVKSALALRQARRDYQESLTLLKLRQDSLTQAQRMFDLGTAGVGQLIDAQRVLQLSQQQEIIAYNTCTHASINLDLVLNETLDRYHVILDSEKAVVRGDEQ